MTLTIGIARLPNIDKSTIFNALARANALATNYPFVTTKPNVGMVPLSDKRLGVLVKMFNSQKIVPTTVSFVGIAGIVKDAPKDEGLDNQFLVSIREADVICQATGAFTDPGVVHVEGKIDPASDIEATPTELISADLQTLEKTIPRLRKEISDRKTPKGVLAATGQYEKVLNPGRTLSSAITVGELDGELVREFQLMISKPFIYMFNMDIKSLADQAKREELAALAVPAEAVFLDGAFEAELVGLDETDAREVLADVGLQESGLDQLAYIGFATLGLQTFLIAGGKESCAWMTHRGWTAPQAAGVIHTDFERGFIKADIISYDNLIKIGDLHEARELDKVRQKDKDHVM